MRIIYQERKQESTQKRKNKTFKQWHDIKRGDTTLVKANGSRTSSPFEKVC